MVYSKSEPYVVVPSSFLESVGNCFGGPVRELSRSGDLRFNFDADIQFFLKWMSASKLIPLDRDDLDVFANPSTFRLQYQKFGCQDQA